MGARRRVAGGIAGRDRALLPPAVEIHRAAAGHHHARHSAVTATAHAQEFDTRAIMGFGPNFRMGGSSPISRETVMYDGQYAPGTIVVIDRGYLDYALYHRWTITDVGFVTRPRTNMLYEVLEQRPVPTRGPVLVDAVAEQWKVPASELTTATSTSKSCNACSTLRTYGIPCSLANRLFRS